MYKLPHIIFIILILVMILSMIFLVCGRKVSEYESRITKVMFGIIILIEFITNRISVTYYLVTYSTGYSWLYLLPSTWCSLNSLIFGILLFFKKPSKRLLDWTIFLALLGGVTNLFLPTYLNTQGFFDIRSLTGLMHHVFSLMAAIYLIITKRYRPDKFSVIFFLLGMTFTMSIGYFEYYVLKFPSAMQINESFFTSNTFLTILTSWPMCILGASLVILVCGILCDFKYKKKCV